MDRKVLLLGSGITVLGALRALAASHYSAECSDSGGVEEASRWYKAACLQSTDIEAIKDWARALPTPPVIIPCSDMWVEALARARPLLDSVGFVAVGTESAVRQFVDKKEFSALVARVAVPAPRVIDPTLQSVSSVPFEEGRWFLKPKMSQHFFAHFGEKAWWPKSKSDAVRLYENAVTANHPMVVQEYIPGPPTNHIYVEGYRRRDGTYDGIFARRRLRMYPPHFGNSTSMVSIGLNEVDGAVHSIRNLVEGADYHGIFSAEFKYDDADQKFKIIEVNIRPWWYVEFAARCGVNLLLSVLREAEGNPPQRDHPYTLGMKMVNMYTDWAELRSRGLGEWFTRPLDWLGSGKTVFVGRDPMPGIRWTVSTFGKALRRRVS